MNKSFDQLIAPILELKPRGEILLESVPAPQKLAPHALAMTADVLEDAATGRFVLLHDPSGQEGWGGQWRCVTFARAAIDLEMASDPLLPEIKITGTPVDGVVLNLFEEGVSGPKYTAYY
jgi:hypothetical protein